MFGDTSSEILLRSGSPSSRCLPANPFHPFKILAFHNGPGVVFAHKLPATLSEFAGQGWLLQQLGYRLGKTIVIRVREPATASPALAAQHRTLAVDQYGHGHRPRLQDHDRKTFIGRRHDEERGRG